MTNKPQYGGGNPKCVRCDKTVYANEKKDGPGGSYHVGCYTCTTCNKRIDSTNLTEKSNVMYCKGCYAKQFGPVSTSLTVNETADQIKPFPGTESRSNLSKGPITSGSNSSLSKSGAMGSASALVKPQAQANQAAVSSDSCPVCKKKVYFAEQIVGPGGVKYHKETCFKCSVCKKMLDSTTVTEKETVLFCKTDYAKLFGPHGNRVGVATLETKV